VRCILALDQGTTSSRALVFDRTGRVLAVARQELSQSFPRPGWVEHDPREIWTSQRAVAVEALEKAGCPARSVAALGITNQRETTILWDRRTGEPIHPAIVWQDRRTAGFCDELKERGLEPLFRERTGLVIDPYFSGSKIRWLLDHIPGVRERAEGGDLAFGTVDSWLVWNLTGGARHATDVTNASRTLLYNIHTGRWDDELLATMGVPAAILPEVLPSSAIYGETVATLHERESGAGARRADRTGGAARRGKPAGVPARTKGRARSAAEETPFPAPIVIGGVAGDQQAALFGQVCTRPGMAKSTYGTGCFLLMNTGDRPVVSENNLLTTVAWRIDDRTEYALEGSVFIAGAAVQWLRDGLGLIEASSEVERLAASVPDSGGVYFVPALAGLGAPHWDPYARGAILGLSRASSAAHVARATLEGIAHQIVDVTRAMEGDSGIFLEQLRVDGGASANDLLMQMQADFLGASVVRPRVAETTALGAAYLAGLAVGFWKDAAEIAGQWAIDRTFEPSLEPGAANAARAGWRKALQRAKSWVDA
jgi:glycerol kinase